MEQRGSQKPDLMGYLLDNTSNDKKGDTVLFAEARVLLAAGRLVSVSNIRNNTLTFPSDTAAVALTEIFILLANFPEYITSIRQELDPVFAESKFSCQTAYPILESIINESLRIYPPVLFGSPRVTPSEGLQIGDVFIPGETVVYMPQYQLHRDPRNFQRPNNFIPERWTTKSDMILNRSAYMPFSMGSFISPIFITIPVCCEY
jgi:cytochrome P450